MTSTHLGPGLGWVDEDRLSINTKDLEADSAFDLGTKSGNIYTLVVLEPQDGIVALQDLRRILEPQAFALQGATAGGSTVHVLHIDIGLCLRLNSLGGGMLVTSPIESITPITDKERVKRIADKVRAEMPREATPEDLEKMETVIREYIEKTFPADRVERIKDFISGFSLPNGKGYILGVLDAALKAEKLDDALDVLAEINREHWYYRPPSMRGEFITPSDVHALESAYRRLGLPLPKGE